MEEDIEFVCPHCWQITRIRIDLSEGGQTYVQDCEVCCNPLEICYETAGDHLESFSAQPAQ